MPKLSMSMKLSKPKTGVVKKPVKPTAKPSPVKSKSMARRMSSAKGC